MPSKALQLVRYMRYRFHKAMLAVSNSIIHLKDFLQCCKIVPYVVAGVVKCFFICFAYLLKLFYFVMRKWFQIFFQKFLRMTIGIVGSCHLYKCKEEMSILGGGVGRVGGGCQHLYPGGKT